MYVINKFLLLKLTSSRELKKKKYNNNLITQINYSEMLISGLNS